MNCSTCKREVLETKHFLEGYRVDWYGTFRIVAEGQTIAESIICINCYDKTKENK